LENVQLPIVVLAWVAVVDTCVLAFSPFTPPQAARNAEPGPTSRPAAGKVANELAARMLAAVEHPLDDAVDVLIGHAMTPGVERRTCGLGSQASDTSRPGPIESAPPSLFGAITVSSRPVLVSTTY
jgi:hypothetical protein